MLRRSLLVVIGLLAWLAAAFWVGANLEENVVLVTLDGARWQEVFTASTSRCCARRFQERRRQ